MSDTTLNRYVSRGTTAERLAFTPDPPVPASGPDHGNFWYDEDLSALYSWDGAAWELVVTAIPDDGVTNAKLANMAEATIKLRALGAGAGDPIDGTAAQAKAIIAPQLEATVGITIDGAGSVITTGIKGFVQVPFGMTITAVRLLADQVGSIVIDVWKDSYANYPPDDADSITAAAPPTLSAVVKSEDTTLTGWTVNIAAGDILGFNVDSVATVTRVVLQLIGTRT